MEGILYYALLDLVEITVPPVERLFSSSNDTLATFVSSRLAQIIYIE